MIRPDFFGVILATLESLIWLGDAKSGPKNLLTLIHFIASFDKKRLCRLRDFFHMIKKAKLLDLNFGKKWPQIKSYFCLLMIFCALKWPQPSTDEFLPFMCRYPEILRLENKSVTLSTKVWKHKTIRKNRDWEVDWNWIYVTNGH